MKRQLVSEEPPAIPFLYEIWNWVGDTSILPIKWLEFLKKVDKQTGEQRFAEITKDYLLSTYVNHPNFDPYSFFFIIFPNSTLFLSDIKNIKKGFAISLCPLTVCFKKKLALFP